MSWDVVVFGAGASGLICATECARRGRRVALVDHAAQPGRKVRISGGGRCNVTNRRVQASNYVCANPHFVKSALAQYPPERFLTFMADNGLRVREEDHGRLFCAGSAGEIVEALRRAATSAGVHWVLGTQVLEVRRHRGMFHVHCRDNILASRSLVVATGGPAWPQVGATDIGLRTALAMGLALTDVRPGLTPLRASVEQAQFCADLSGISLPVRVTVPQTSIPDGIEDALLFTHRGISGPAVLDASLFWSAGRHLEIDFLPDRDLDSIMEQGMRREIHNALAMVLPARLAQKLCAMHGWTGQICNTSKKTRSSMHRLIHAFPFHPAGTEGYARAEVTMGGVDTSMVSSKTMEAKAVPGLFFTGEVLDVAGRLGGYNLQWAWSSGFVAGQWA